MAAFEASNAWKFRQKQLNEELTFHRSCLLLLVSVICFCLSVFLTRLWLPLTSLNVTLNNETLHLQQFSYENAVMENNVAKHVANLNANLSFLNRRAWIITSIKLNTLAIRKALKNGSNNLKETERNSTIDFEQEVELGYQSEMYVKSGVGNGGLFSRNEPAFTSIQLWTRCGIEDGAEGRPLTYADILDYLNEKEKTSDEDDGENRKEDKPEKKDSLLRKGTGRGPKWDLKNTIYCDAGEIYKLTDIRDEKYWFKGYLQSPVLLLNVPTSHQKSDVELELVHDKYSFADMPLWETSYTLITFDSTSVAHELYTRFFFSALSSILFTVVAILLYRNVGLHILEEYQKYLLLLCFFLLLYNNPFFPLSVANIGYQNVFKTLDFSFQSIFLASFFIFWISICQEITNPEAVKGTGWGFNTPVKVVLFCVFTFSKSVSHAYQHWSTSKLLKAFLTAYVGSSCVFAISLFYYTIYFALFLRSQPVMGSKFFVLFCVTCLVFVFLVWQMVTWKSMDPSFISCSSAFLTQGRELMPEYFNVDRGARLLKETSGRYDDFSNLATYAVFNFYVFAVALLYTPWKVHMRRMSGSALEDGIQEAFLGGIAEVEDGIEMDTL